MSYLKFNNNEILNEFSLFKDDYKGEFCLPLDFKNIGKDKMICVNTHILNLGIGVLTNAITSATLITAILSVLTKKVPSFGWWITNFKWGLGIGALLAIGPLMEQGMARDFITVNENSFSPSFGTNTIEVNKIKVISIGNGKVVHAAEQKDDPEGVVYGANVVVQYSEYLYALYAHIATGSIKVKKGDNVKKGQELGLAGTSGNSSMPHLHFELCARNPKTSWINLPRSLSNFEDNYIMDLEFLKDWIFQDKEDLKKILLKANNHKNWELNKTGEIPSICLIKSK